MTAKAMLLFLNISIPSVHFLVHKYKLLHNKQSDIPELFLNQPKGEEKALGPNNLLY